MKTEMKDIQFSLGNNSKVAEAKLREEAQNVYRNVDVKIDRNKKDIQNLLAEFKNSIALSVKRQEDYTQTLRSPNEVGSKGENSEGFEKNLQDRVRIINFAGNLQVASYCSDNKHEKIKFSGTLLKMRWLFVELIRSKDMLIPFLSNMNVI